MQKAISYLRLSKRKKNEKSSYSFAVQDHTNKGFAKDYHYKIVKTIKEIKSGRNKNRIVLNDILELCKRLGYTLIISKLDRMVRNVLFVSTLIESGVSFKVAEMPHASKYDILRKAASDEEELDRISIRTKEALAEAKRRGVKLGYHAHKHPDKNKNKVRADSFAKRKTRLFLGLLEKGYSIRGIVDYLNTHDIKPYSGHDAIWHKSTVYNVMMRIKTMRNEAKI